MEACSLTDLKCVPCRGGAAPLKGKELSDLHAELDGWDLVDEHHLTKTYSFPDFARALELVDRVGALAEEQGHHPDIHLSWGKVRIEVHTHKIDGLTKSDFILAAKIDALERP